jgi:ATP-binding cassette subfamily C protein
MKIFKNTQNRFENYQETLKKCFSLLTKPEIYKLVAVGVAQMVLAVLDLVGVLSIGLIGALSVYGIQSRTPAGQITSALKLLNLDAMSLQFQVAILGSLAGVILIFKSLISAYIQKRTLYFLSARSAALSARLIEKMAFSNVEQINRRSRFENIFLLTNGVQSITVGIIGTIVAFFSDFSLVVIMFVGLLAVDPSIALSTVLFFGSLAYFLYRSVNSRLVELVNKDTENQIINTQLLYELFGIFREIFVRGMRKDYVTRIAEQRMRSSFIASEIAFLPSISKYALEIAFVVGAFIFIGFQFLIKDAVGAISTIGVFIASTGRIMPAILRIQGAAITLRGSVAGAKRTLDVIGELDAVILPKSRESLMENQDHFQASLTFNDVSFTYRDNSYPTLKSLSFEISEGEWIAIAGPSGAGKTTLVDLMLGILKPSEGSIELSGLEPEITVNMNPGSVAYVPQEGFFVEGTLKQNVALGIADENIDSEYVELCLRTVGLDELVKSSNLGINIKVGELGSKISGGQKQRLGIARALYSTPKLLILDEATSALDAISEDKIIECLKNLKGKITIVSIAHRLSTIMSADRVFYLEEGQIMASGKFNEVRNAVPNFDRQADILGISKD